MMTDLSICAEELPSAQRLGVGRHRQLQHIEEDIGDILSAAEGEITASLFFG